MYNHISNIFPPIQEMALAHGECAREVIQPAKLTWNLKLTQVKRKIIFQTSIFWFHVNFPGCISNIPFGIGIFFGFWKNPLNLSCGIIAPVLCTALRIYVGQDVAEEIELMVTDLSVTLVLEACQWFLEEHHIFGTKQTPTWLWWCCEHPNIVLSGLLNQRLPARSF